MEYLDSPVVVIFVILYLIYVSIISDRYNKLLKTSHATLKSINKKAIEQIKIDEISRDFKSFKKRAFSFIMIFPLAQASLHLMLNIGYIKRGWYWWITPNIFLTLGLFIFFLFALYVILYVLKGRGTIDSRPAKNQQFPFPF